MEDDKGNVLDAKVEVIDPQKTEGTPEPVKEGDSGTPKEPEKTDDSKGAEPSGAEKRIKQLVAEKHARDREIERLKGELDKKPKEEKVPQPVMDVSGMPPKPQAKDFEDYDDYLEARAVWRVKYEGIKEEQAKAQKRTQEAIASLDSTFQDRIVDDSVKNPEITNMRDRVGTKISTAVGFAIKQSELAPDLIRYLDANPTEMERLSKLDLVAAAREVGKIEVRLTSKGNTKKKSDAPPPEKSEKGSGSVTSEKSEDEIPIDDYMKEFRKKGRK